MPSQPCDGVYAGQGGQDVESVECDGKGTDGQRADDDVVFVLADAGCLDKSLQGPVRRAVQKGCPYEEAHVCVEHAVAGRHNLEEDGSQEGTFVRQLADGADLLAELGLDAAVF